MIAMLLAVVVALIAKEWLPQRRHRGSYPTQPTPSAGRSVSPPAWSDAASARLLADLRKPTPTYGKITTPPLTGTPEEIVAQLITDTTGYPRRSQS